MEQTYAIVEIKANSVGGIRHSLAFGDPRDLGYERCVQEQKRRMATKELGKHNVWEGNGPMGSRR